MKKEIVILFLILLVVAPMISAAFSGPLNESAVPSAAWDIMSKETIFAVVVIGIALILFLVYWLLQSGLGGA